ncbi:MAG: phosphoribosylformylglycinamidine cyclo-ligase [Phoenicibacter congonensis]|uniref:Phosphoribosylformylglycinamidine cyclo-ligase n=1 Tax=Phoenicibacter congonensis TaxID=1944646 RepID=A0AA43U8G3_9ACTN|nr:phosphoribosylformylglycinamidine cyclo-ligase [Phoenicibacter congonensis]
MGKYAEAGVDVEAGYRAVELMKKHVARTTREECVGGLGGFGGAFSIKNNVSNMTSPTLVSGTDGVGTKLKIAHILDKHDTVGIDCVAMCVNDIACAGAEPLLFLDYIACGKNNPEKIEQIVAGISDGCVMAGCALVGGETAEMPGFYAENEYDLAGFSVGLIDADNMISPDDQKLGDVIVGLESSGVHSNGFSLVRKLFDIDNNPDVLNKHYDELGKTLGEELITPTRIYVKPLLEMTKKQLSKGFMHITGGGFIENLPRGIKPGLAAQITKSKVPVKPIFKLMQQVGEIEDDDIYNTFNMGIGMCVVTAPENVDEVISISEKFGDKAHVIGELVEGEKVSFL